MKPSDGTANQRLARHGGVDRREFLRIITMSAAAVGLPAAAAAKMAETAAAGLKPSVIWLHFQECTGCTESLLRASHPALASLILDLVSLDYHETLFAAAGTQAEDALKTAMDKGAGKYICVVEGSIPTRDGGVYCKVGGRTAMEMFGDVAQKAAAVIAIGSCASWGGVQSAAPNPTGARGAPDVLKFLDITKPVVTLPGCPANPYNFLGTALQYVTFNRLPSLDSLGRPMFAYGRLIHSVCPRRAHFNAGRFAERFGDEAHRSGYCLYKLGCKGPVTHANCSVLQFGDVVGAWPVGIGHPCAGCTEKEQAFTTPIYETADIPNPRPSWLFPPATPGQHSLSAVATGVGGLVGGALLGAGYVASKKIMADAQSRPKEEPSHGD
jgi:hydrogenase small subunit